MNKAIGRCSHCGGTVVVPEVWHGVEPPVPKCQNCGATASNRHLPVIDMDPPGTQGKGYEPKFDPLEAFRDAIKDAFLLEDDVDDWGFHRRYSKSGW